ncbi:MAG: trypsin-like peptidase domain-containing protein [Gammaproteobacteria bacterium]|nr:trypsin-like peptidase domain-containing protein [Gammaproteobacteria bacterium]
MSSRPLKNVRSKYSLIGAIGAIVLVLLATTSFAHIPEFMNGERPSLAPVIDGMKDAVVNISVTTRQGYRIAWFDEWGQLNPRRYHREAQSAGSGVIIDAKQGLVVTNHHVIAQAIKIVITLQDQRSFDAEFLGSDPTTDIAVLRIAADDLTELKLGDSEVMRVGDFVIAIGNPFGIGQTVTSGIVSALGRNQIGIAGVEDFIQTDASINRGNSGGALIDIEGNLVGINTAILSPSGGSSGIGFAIPSNMVKAIAEQLIEYGDISRGMFGIEFRPITRQYADALDLPTINGVVVTKVVAGSGAEIAGMRIDDVITEVDGKEIANSQDLLTKIALLRVGQEFDLKVFRKGEEHQIQGTVQEFEIGNELVQGVYVDDIPASNPYYGRIRGVVVSTVDGRVTETQLMVGDIILEVNRERISRLSDLQSINLDRRPLILLVLRGTQQFRLQIG